MSCSGPSLKMMANRITAVCCTRVGVTCTAGLPTQCSAPCAALFRPFYEHCGRALQANVRYRAFYTACGGGTLDTNVALGMPVKTVTGLLTLSSDVNSATATS